MKTSISHIYHARSIAPHNVSHWNFGVIADSVKNLLGLLLSVEQHADGVLYFSPNVEFITDSNPIWHQNQMVSLVTETLKRNGWWNTLMPSLVSFKRSIREPAAWAASTSCCSSAMAPHQGQTASQPQLLQRTAVEPGGWHRWTAWLVIYLLPVTLDDIVFHFFCRKWNQLDNLI